MRILMEVSGTCVKCKPEMLKRLSEVSGPEGDAVVIHES
jgi:hypothetical protein